jgi:cation-transporting ATPase 13A2
VRNAVLTMDDVNGGVPINGARRSREHRESSTSNGPYRTMYRRDSNLSTSSFLDEVEMAQDEMFSGPMGESVPTSVSSFAHRRGRADSTASFTYYQEDEEEPLPPSSEDDSAILDDESEFNFEEEEEEDSVDHENGEVSRRRTSSGHSRASVHDRLLRSDSARTDGSVLGPGHRTSQKIYVVTEDLTIVIAGFKTSTLGFAVYTTVCVLTLGLGYLVLRWLPRWKVRLIGRVCALRDCNWVVIEVSTSLLCSLGCYLPSY